MSSTTMGTVRVVALALAAAIPAVLRAQTPHEWSLQPGSNLVVNGTSNVKDFACKADTMKVQVTTPDAGAMKGILAGSHPVLSATVTVATAQLDCDNGTMNDHMRDALKMKEHPDIVFRIDSFTIAKSGGVTATVHGTLTLGGTAKPITVVVHPLDGGSGVMHVAGSYPLLMSDYGLKPPTLMLGVLKVHDPVQIVFDLILKGT
jgi:polyisoprenoid-binding protein YceI